MTANAYNLQALVQYCRYVHLFLKVTFIGSVDVRMLGFCFLHDRRQSFGYLRTVMWDMDFCILCPLYLYFWHLCCTETCKFCSISAVHDCYSSLLVLLSFVLACWIIHLDIRVCCASGLWICISRHLFICLIDKLPPKSVKGCKSRVQEGCFQKKLIHRKGC